MPILLLIRVACEFIAAGRADLTVRAQLSRGNGVDGDAGGCISSNIVLD
jgi:hypothetical protein